MFVGIKIKMKDTNTFDQHTKIRIFFFTLICVFYALGYTSKPNMLLLPFTDPLEYRSCLNDAAKIVKNERSVNKVQLLT